MNLNYLKKNVYMKKQNKTMCTHMSFCCAAEYLTDLRLIYHVEDDNAENFHGLVNCNKLFCNACVESFVDAQSMRNHMWTRNHMINNGCIERDEPESDTGNSDENEYVNGNICKIKKKCHKKALEKENERSSLKRISMLRTSRITFTEACMFEILFFRHQSQGIIGIKRCLLFNKHNKPRHCTELLERVEHLKSSRKIAMFLYSGGCFAGAIYVGNECLLQTSFEYCPKKVNGKPGKMSPELRAKVLRQIYWQVHREWRQHVQEADLILVWASRCQRHVLSQHPATEADLYDDEDKEPVFQVLTDPRVRFVPGRVAVVNCRSLAHMFDRVTTIQMFDSAVLAEALEIFERDQEVKAVSKFNKKEKTEHFDMKKKTWPQSILHASALEEKVELAGDNIRDTLNNLNIEESCHDAKSRKIRHKETSDNLIKKTIQPFLPEDVGPRKQLHNYVLNDSGEDFVALVTDLLTRRSPEDVLHLVNATVARRRQSFLHVAVRNDCLSLLEPLLRFGCDPIHRNAENETAYALALRLHKKKACTCMSQFMFRNPTKFDYHASKFPGGRDPEAEFKRKLILDENMKIRGKQQKLRAKEQRRHRLSDMNEKCKKDNFLTLSDQAKVDLLQYIQKNRKYKFALCFQCSDDISCIVPFSYLDFQFCSMDCLNSHKSILENKSQLEKA